MESRIKGISLLLIMVLAFSNRPFAQVHNNDSLWYNNGAEVFIGADVLITVQGDVTNNQAGVTGITHLTNNGFLWVQGNMYGDNAFKQAGNGVARLQNKTPLYTAPYAGESYQVIQGGYRVNGAKAQIGASDDGSFYSLELDNQNGQVFVKTNTDVRSSVDFKPATVTVDGLTIAPNGTVNRIITCDPTVALPANGADYPATFGMMDSTAGLANFKNLSTNLTTNTVVSDSAYIQGKLRRALKAISGGNYGFPLGLEPSTSSTAARGIQYAKLDFTDNAYDVLTGYFQQGSDNTDASPSLVCDIARDFVYYGASNHGEWVFTPSTSASNPYDLTIYPQDYGTTNSQKYFITKDNNVPVPGIQSCATSPLGLSVSGLTGFSEFDFAGGSIAVLNPDINVTYINVSVPGDVSTNDTPIPGSTYGNPPVNPNNPSDCAPVMNPDSSGKYTFTCDSAGTYTFDIPVCDPGGSPCKSVPLTITVLDSKDTTTAPIANPDYGTTKEGVPVIIPVTANDKCQNGPTCTLGTPTVVTPPSHGTFNPGTGEYIPTGGFVGTDTLVYSVCDNQSPSKCDTSFVFITVLPLDAPNSTTAADDYAQTPYGTVASGNVKNNDTDPEKDLQTVTPQTTNIPGKGELVLNADGTYTFTPAPGFSGPVEFTYTTCDTVSAPNKACASATLHILVEPKEPPVLNPDINVTYINVPVPGDVSTNDIPTPGSTYGTPPVNPNNPSDCAPLIATDGTYTFVCDSAGTYTFDVPVCDPGGSPCKSVPLTITVLDSRDTTTAPIANPDYGTTKEGVPVIIPVTANDKCQNGPTCTLGTPTVVTPPSNGTFNPSTGEYIPTGGFVGTDTLVYSVCDNQSPSKCDTSFVFITVLPLDAPNSTTAADDYAQTPYGTVASGNVKNNDTDPEKDLQTVTPQTTNIPGKGELVLNADGTYTFTPAPGFSGPVEFTYTTCDTVSAPNKACASATLHILVEPKEPPVLNPDINVTYINVPVPGDVSTNDIPTPGSTYGNPPVNPNNPSNCAPLIATDGTYTFVCDSAGTYTFDVPVCDPGGSPCKSVPLTITVLDSRDTTTAPIANPDYGTTKEGVPVTIPVTANDKCQNGPTCTLGTPTVVTPPSNGTFNPSTGEYIPTGGFVGTDTLVYAVCDNQSPSKCDTSFVYITVLPSNAPNSTTAADDYAQTPYGTAVSGNVKNNDTDPEKDLQTVTPQTTNIPGKGELVLNADGTYTFTPDPTFSGAVEFPYTTCDTVSSPNTACANATLHILVEPKEPVLTPDVNVTNKDVQVSGDVSENDEQIPGSTYGNPPVNPTNPSDCVPTMNPDGSGKYTFICDSVGTYTFNVPVCEPDGGQCKSVLLTIQVTISLPVHLTNFTVVATDNCTAKLNWASATELNVRSYELQYSKNGSNFTTVRTVIPKGSNATYSETYQPEVVGYTSYRLKIIDNDGSVSYSKIVSQQINCNKADAFVSVFPNPVSSSANIQLNRTSSLIGTKAALVDVTGKLVRQKMLTNSIELLDMNGLPAGIYLLKFADGTVKKIVKK